VAERQSGDVFDLLSYRPYGRSLMDRIVQAEIAKRINRRLYVRARFRGRPFEDWIRSLTCYVKDASGWWRGPVEDVTDRRPDQLILIIGPLQRSDPPISSLPHDSTLVVRDGSGLERPLNCQMLSRS